MSRRTSCCSKRISVLVTLFAMAMFGLRATPALAVDDVESSCDGKGGTTTCDLFQLDGSQNVTANGDTCVGSENGCPAEENPVWPADWDALLYPNLTSGAVPIISGAAPGAYSFSLPWNSFGSFSGVIKSTLVTTGTSTILKQGSKNNADISTWVVASQASPPKDAYLAGAIASYIGPTGSPVAGDEILYLGSTRFSPNGSATVGIWFFKQNVAVCASGRALCIAGTTTVAQHQDGDLFLFLTFSGGGHATIQAAKWVGTGPSGSLGSANSLITCPTANDQACAVTNELSSIVLGSPTGSQAPGAGFNVSGPGWPGFANGVVPALQFQEAGVDLNDIFGGTAPCFSSVMFASVTSGSSPANASMKSILLGSFNTCAITVNKTCGNASPNTTTGNIQYTVSGTVENTGGGAVTDLSVADFLNGSTTATAYDSGSLSCTCGLSGCSITNHDCTTATIAPGGTLNYSFTITTSLNGPSDQVAATMNGAGGGTASANSNPYTCPSVSYSSGVSISKSCSPGTSLVSDPDGDNKLVVQVGVGGTITNSNAGNLALSNVTVYDCVGAQFSALQQAGTCLTPTEVSTAVNSCAANKGTLRTVTINSSTISGQSGNNTEAWSDTYYPSVAPASPFTFSDQALVTATCASGFCQCANVAGESSTASCSLCQ